MAKAGYCSQCNAQVWVDEDGTCANCHSGEYVSGVYDAGVPPAPAPRTVTPQPPQPQPVAGTAAKSNKKTIWIVVAVVLVLLCACVGIFAAVGASVFRSASDAARQRSCFANERVMEGAYQQYLASSPQATPATDMASLQTDILGEGFVKHMPVCPSGGTYSMQPTADGIKIICSVHGSYQDSPASSTP